MVEATKGTGREALQKNWPKMNDMIKKTSINGLYVIERPTFPDERGFFHEVFRLAELEEVGIEFEPVSRLRLFGR